MSNSTEQPSNLLQCIISSRRRAQRTGWRGRWQRTEKPARLEETQIWGKDNMCSTPGSVCVSADRRDKAQMDQKHVMKRASKTQTDRQTQILPLQLPYLCTQTTDASLREASVTKTVFVCCKRQRMTGTAQVTWSLHDMIPPLSFFTPGFHSADYWWKVGTDIWVRTSVLHPSLHPSIHPFISSSISSSIHPLCVHTSSCWLCRILHWPQFYL